MSQARAWQWNPSQESACPFPIISFLLPRNNPTTFILHIINEIRERKKIKLSSVDVHSKALWSEELKLEATRNATEGILYNDVYREIP